jgi:hypothetical protein
MEAFKELLEPLTKWGSTRETLSNGVLLVCHVPHVAPQAWLNIFYPGLTQSMLDEYELKFPVKFPSELRLFLNTYNGMNIFSDSMSIWGWRRSYERTGKNIYQPYDLFDLNQERPKGCPEEWLFFGSYSEDGSCVFIDTHGDGKVFRAAQRSKEIIGEWDSIKDWIEYEIDEHSRVFDSEGHHKDE